MPDDKTKVQAWMPAGASVLPAMLPLPGTQGWHHDVLGTEVCFNPMPGVGEPALRAAFAQQAARAMNCSSSHELFAQVQSCFAGELPR